MEGGMRVYVGWLDKQEKDRGCDGDSDAIHDL
jgi:hypothetical protein